jgi:sialic acid synthase SpsE
VAERSGKRGVGLYLDVFGLRSLDLASDLGAKGIKLHSTDLLNGPLLRAVAASSVDTVLLSAGGTYRKELEAAVRILKAKNLILMHGFQGYPTLADANQIARIGQLKRQFPDCRTGSQIMCQKMQVREPGFQPSLLVQALLCSKSTSPAR